MNRLKVAIAAALVASMSGCAVQKVATPIGGSRSDGVVRLGFTVGLFEKPVVDWNQAGNAARQRCMAWGYSDAQAFGGQTTQCINTDYNGACNLWQVNVVYQCAGQPEASTPTPTPPPAAKPATATYEGHPGG